MPPRQVTTVTTKGGLRSVVKGAWDFRLSEQIVKDRHHAFKHAWQLLDYIWLSLRRTGTSPAAIDVDEGWVKEIVKQMLAFKRITCGERTNNLRALFARYFDKYEAATGFKRVDLKEADKWATYQAREMLKCIKNHLSSEFGPRFKGVVYRILGTGRLAADVRRGERLPGGSRFRVYQEVDRQVYDPAKEVMEEVSKLEHPRVCNLSADHQRLLYELVDMVRASIPTDHVIQINILYDVKVSPLAYLSAFVNLLGFCERNNMLRAPHSSKRIARLWQLRDSAKQRERAKQRELARQCERAKQDELAKQRRLAKQRELGQQGKRKRASLRDVGHSQLKQPPSRKRKRPDSSRTYLRRSKRRRTFQSVQEPLPGGCLPATSEEEAGGSTELPLLPTFKPFPLCTSWIPGSAMVDSTLALKNLVPTPPRTLPEDPLRRNLAIWRKVVDVRAKVFKKKRKKTLSFCGSLRTDGVSICVIKQQEGATLADRLRPTDPADPSDDEEIPEVVGDSHVEGATGDAVPEGGPGDANAEGDPSAAVSEGGAGPIPTTQTGADGDPIPTVRPEADGASGSAVSQPDGSGQPAVSVGEGGAGEQGNERFPYVHRLPQAVVKQLFKDDAAVIYFDPNCRDIIYGMVQKSTNEIRLMFRFTLDELNFLTGRRAYRRVCMTRKPRKVAAAERALARGPSPAVTDPAAFLEHVRVRAQAEGVLRRYYEQPFFRQKRLELYGREQRTYANLVNRLRRSFTGLKVVVFGDWRPHGLRHHPPIPIERLKCLFHEAGFTVLMVDEYCTSKFCPACGEELKKNFKVIQNPRPQTRPHHSTEHCHGLLYCDSASCKAEVAQRLAEEATKREAAKREAGQQKTKEPGAKRKSSYWKDKKKAWKAKAIAEKRAATEKRAAPKELPPDASPKEKKMAMRRAKKAAKKAKGKERKANGKAARQQAQREANKKANQDFWHQHPELKGCRFWNRDTVAVLNQRKIVTSLRDHGVVPLKFRRPEPLPAAPSWLVAAGGSRDNASRRDSN